MLSVVILSTLNKLLIKNKNNKNACERDNIVLNELIKSNFIY